MVGSHASPPHDWWPTTHTIFTVFLNFLSTLSPSLYLLFAFQLSTPLIYNSQVWFVLTTQFLTPITLNGLYLLLLFKSQFKCPHNTIIAYCDPDFNLQSLSSSPTPYNFYDIPLGNKGICIPYTNDCPNLPDGQPGSRNVWLTDVNFTTPSEHLSRHCRVT